MVLAGPPPWQGPAFGRTRLKSRMAKNAVECALSERETGHADFATRRYARSRRVKGANRLRGLRIRPRFWPFLISSDAGRCLEGSAPFVRRPPVQLDGEGIAREAAHAGARQRRLDGATPSRWRKALEFGISRRPSAARGSEALAKRLVRESRAPGIQHGPAPWGGRAFRIRCFFAIRSRIRRRTIFVMALVDPLGWAEAGLPRFGAKRNAPAYAGAFRVRSELESLASQRFHRVLRLAALEGMRPARNVRSTLMPTRTMAACHGSEATSATSNSE